MRLPLLTAVALTLFPAAYGQTTVDAIHVRVLNGRSGKPIRHAHAIVEILPRATYETPVAFIADGGGSFSLLAPAAGGISTHVVLYRPCETSATPHPKRSPTAFPVTEILSTGVLAPDTCGHPTAHPQPGTLVLYVRPQPWWRRYF